MAEKKDIEFAYTSLDKIFRLSIGETGDFSGAKYDGDFLQSLEEAQKNKYKYVSSSINARENQRILDMGCGWGPILTHFKNFKNIEAIGLTLSSGQANACRKNGLKAYVKDCRYIDPKDFGCFDSVISIGAFEHFCTPQDYLNGRQTEVYSSFFETVAKLLPPAGRFFLQTMVYGKNMINIDQIDINAPRNSDAYILALMIKQFPGSWLPYGPEMVINCAEPGFKLISKSSGRLDYIETIAQWRKKFRKFHLKKYWLYLSLLPKYFTDLEFKHLVKVFKISPNKICFEKEIMDHYRLVFEKV